MHKNALYSPRQIFWGTFFGGPFPLLYFLSQNFRGLNRATEAKQTLFIGVPAAIALLVLLLLIPTNISVPVFIACAFAGKQLAQDKQFGNPLVPKAQIIHSNWRVFWGALTWFLVWAAIVVLGIIGLEAIGITIDA